MPEWTKGKFKVKKATAVGVMARGKEYSVKDLGDTMAGYVELTKKELGVCRTDTPHTRWVQLHELSHIQWSKVQPEVIASAAKLKRHEIGRVLAAEDARVNTKLMRRVPDAHAGFALPDNNLRYDLDGYVASWQAPQECKDRIYAGMPDHHKALAPKVDAKLAELCKGSMTVRDFTVPLARFMQDLLDTPPEQEQEQQQGGQQGQGSGDEQGDEQEQQSGGSDEQQGDEQQDEQGSGGGDGEDGEEDEQEGSSSSDGDEDGDEQEQGSGDPQEGEGESKQEGKDTSGNPHAGGENNPNAGDEGDVANEGDDADGMRESKQAYNDPTSTVGEEPERMNRRQGPSEWMMPRFHEPELSQRCERPGTNLYTSTDRGMRVRRLERVLTDGKVFGRKTTRPGTIQRGTFLIDMSGSMSLREDQVKAIVHAVPGATVAGYSSYGITILAKNGKVCEGWAMRGHGGSNGCDGPALLWLSRQQGPRFWYGDAWVNGKAGNVNDMRDECFAICKAGRITHINPEPFEKGVGDQSQIYARTPNVCEGVTVKQGGEYPRRGGTDHAEFIMDILRKAGMIR